MKIDDDISKETHSDGNWTYEWWFDSSLTSINDLNQKLMILFQKLMIFLKIYIDMKCQV